MLESENQKLTNKETLYDALNFQKQSKKSILALMQSFAESTNSIDVGSVDEIKKCLENMKASLDLCNKNISTLDNLIKDVNNINIFNNTDTEDSTSPQSNSQSEKISESNSVITKEFITNTIDNNTTISKEAINNAIEKSQIIEESNKESIDSNYSENTLIISEKSGTVILPYELSSLKQKLNKSNNSYSSIDEIIKKEYSLPISLFKNPFVARFRESYKLMRKREKSSIKDAFDLGLELMFNYNLHPAIISACKDLDELDIYLDYLDSGETNKFKFFKVLFDVAPTVVKSKHDF